MQPKLTPKQTALLEFIRDYMAEHDRAPTMVEMAAHKGIVAKSAIHKVLVHFEEIGVIRRSRRQIEILN